MCRPAQTKSTEIHPQNTVCSLVPGAQVQRRRGSTLKKDQIETNLKMWMEFKLAWIREWKFASFKPLSEARRFKSRHIVTSFWKEARSGCCWVYWCWIVHEKKSYSLKLYKRAWSILARLILRMISIHFVVFIVKLLWKLRSDLRQIQP